MRIYHGSNQIVYKPLFLESKHSTDFGRGFYTTESMKQAENWAIKIKNRRESEHAYVSEYEYNEANDLVTIAFEGPTEEWLDFVTYNRLENKGHEYDVIIGPVADDSVYETLFDYSIGRITKEEAILELKSVTLDGQILFHTDKSLEYVTFLGYKEVS